MARIVSGDGEPMIVIDSMSAANREICLRGRLLGTMYAEMYIQPREFLAMLRMLLSPSIILFALKLPYILLAERGAAPKEETK